MNVKFKCLSGETYTLTDHPTDKKLLVLNGGVFKNMDIENQGFVPIVGEVYPVKYADTENSKKHIGVYEYGKCVLTTVQELTDLEKKQ